MIFFIYLYLFFYSDFSFYKINKCSISGLEYIKHNFGPYSNDLDEILYSNLITNLQCEEVPINKEVIGEKFIFDGKVNLNDYLKYKEA